LRRRRSIASPAVSEHFVMYNKGAYDKAAYEKAAYEKAAYEKAAYEKAAYDKAAYDKAAYDKGAYNKGAYDKGAYDKGAYDKGAYDKGAPAAGGASSGATTIASTGSIAAAAAHTGAPLKILCLHGGGMSGPGFERQLSDLRNRFGPLVQLVCPTAPRGVGDAGLWFGDPGKQGAESVGWWDESVTQLRSVIATQGPFDGVLGYSMGCTAAFSLLAAVPEGTFRFALLACGYLPVNHDGAMAQLAARRPLSVPSLHMHGAQDNTIPNDSSRQMLPYFAEGAAEVCAHPGAHDVPRDPAGIEQLAAFLLRFATPAVAAS